MKFTKELEKRIDKEIEEYEQAKKEGKMKFYTHEEVMKNMLGEDYRPEVHSYLFK